MPCWVLLVVVISGRLEEVIVFGPVFSSHVWSTIWLAIVWPSTRFSLGAMRWMVAG